MKFAVRMCESLKDLPPLFFRLILAYGFLGPALKKLENVGNIAAWFENMNYWYPKINAYLVTGIETAGFILLFLGLFTRLISIPLMVIMGVAIVTVHLGNGFEAAKGGFEVPLYYFFMLFSLVTTGAGRLSFDHLFFRNKD